ncbi:MAG: metallophosphoesterase [Deltaproteobacteria bacterium]|nr:metallophosphoesterase [Deltaproteobacteria bacterium]
MTNQRWWKRFIGVVVPVAILLATGNQGTAQEAPNPTVLAQYVLMAHGDLLDRTVPLARVILAQPAASCPEIELSGGNAPLPMSLRSNPNPSAFGVVVCEAIVLLKEGVIATVEGQTNPLPVPTEGEISLNQVVVFGDSGCKGGDKQVCQGSETSPATWPFPQIASAAAETAPDLVIHVGDYNYSGTPNKTGAGQWSYDGCVPADGGPLVHQSTYDTWTTWQADFFKAAEPLLAAAPWVFVRGNHELCSRAGQGWFYFLDAHSPLLNPYEAQPSCQAATALTQPYKLSFSNLDLVVLDSANACGGEDPESAAGTAYEVSNFMRQLTTVNALVNGSQKPAWLVAHRPIWSLYQDSGSPPSTENTTLQAALAATPAKGLAAPIKMVLSGHMHQFFSLTFQEGNRPPQLVIGDSGVALSSNSLPSSFSQAVDGIPASGLSLNGPLDYGYLAVEMKNGGQWKGTVKAFSASGEAQVTPLAVCGLPTENGRLCQEGMASAQKPN